MHAYQLIHPWQSASNWTGTRRRPEVVVDLDAPTAATPSARRWTGGIAAATHHVFKPPTPRTLPDNRSHYYPSRCVYLETSGLSRMMDHL